MRWLFRTLLPVMLIISLVGCDSLVSPKEEDNNTPPVAVAGSDQDVDIGDTVTLDGSSSTDPDGDNLTFQWELVSRPDASSASIQNSTSESASFVADSRGSYEVKLTVSDGTDNDSDDLSVTAEIMVIGNVDSDITLSDIFDDSDEADYAVTSTANINAVLTIEPGVKIEFASGARMDVESGGTLIAVGTEEDSIVFTGATQVAGSWDGIHFASLAVDNELSYASVTYGGDGGYANIYVGSNGGVKINHTRSDLSLTYGLTAVNGADLRDFSENSFDGNTMGSLEIPANLIGSLDSESMYAGSVGDGIIAVSGSDVSSDQTWSMTDAPYIMDGTTNILSEVTVKPGAIFKFTQGSRLDVQGTDGAIIAVGKSDADSSIQFLGNQEVAGYWDGIYIQTNNLLNELSYVEVSHGGDGGYANVDVSSSGGVKITNSVFTMSATYGLDVGSSGVLREFSDNTFEDDAMVNIPPEMMGMMDANSSYAGTGGTGYIFVDGGDVDTDQTWSATDGPFRIDGTVNIYAAVAVDPGATIEFTAGQRLDVASGGSLSAVGTDVNMIQFLGTQSVAGHWDGIYFTSNNMDNELTYVEVSHGGSGGYANVEVSSSAGLKVNNSIFTMSATYGIDVNSGGVLYEFSNNTFEDDAIVNIPAAQMGMMDDGSSYAGTGGTGYISVEGGDITAAQTWSATDGPFRIDGTVNIQSDVSVNPGAYLEFTDGQRIDVESGGSLNAVGTSVDSIHFVGENPVQGYWDGLHFAVTDANNLLEYCVIAHGGSGGYANIYVGGSGSVTVNNSTIRDSGTYGVVVQSGGSFTESGNDYINNSSGDKDLP